MSRTSEQIKRQYQAKFRRYGFDSRSLNWKRLGASHQRFRQIWAEIDFNGKSVLDVGCADGAVTLAMAEIFPKIKFLGIDLNKHFLSRATGQAKTKKLKNVKFEKIYLRDLLARFEKFDAVSFVSVLHEFFTYGEGDIVSFKGSC